MGFTTGFTGGVTITLSLAYLTVLAHKRNREHQGQVLRSQAYVLQGLVDPLPPLPPPPRSEVAAAQRATAVEVAKERWNQEVENAVRWVQHTNWSEVRERLEDSAWRLLGKTSEGTVEDVRQRVGPLVREGADELDRTSSKVASAAEGAFAKAKAEGEKAEAKGKGFIAAAIEKGRDLALGAGQEISEAGKAVEGKAEGANTVEKALSQRYQKPEAKVNRTVEQVLAERYTPMDQRDNTVLRGV